MIIYTEVIYMRLSSDLVVKAVGLGINYWWTYKFIYILYCLRVLSYDISLFSVCIRNVILWKQSSSFST